MNVTQQDNGDVLIEISLDEGNRLATSIMKHAEELPSPALDLASLVRQARYAARDSFHQPPHAWDQGQKNPSL